MLLMQSLVCISHHIPLPSQTSEHPILEETHILGIYPYVYLVFLIYISYIYIYLMYITYYIRYILCMYIYIYTTSYVYIYIHKYIVLRQYHGIPVAEQPVGSHRNWGISGFPSCHAPQVNIFFMPFLFWLVVETYLLKKYESQFG